MDIAYKAGVPALILALALAGGAAPLARAEDHTSHDSSHSSEGKGPKYSGGRDHGSSHSDQTHEEGSHSGHTGGPGGSKALENKVFDSGRGKGPKYMGGQPNDEDSTHHTDSEEHEH